MQGGELGNGSVFRFDPTPVRLAIRSDLSNVEISWPASSTEDVLQAAGQPSSSQWQAVERAISREGFLFKYRPATLNSSQFFRLLRDWQ